MCDRVLVMREGMVTGELAGADATEEAIMGLATAHPASPHEAAA
jgi:ABC-type sugar transport system ATPase subunit